MKISSVVGSSSGEHDREIAGAFEMPLEHGLDAIA
jgi:hypothetical protein